MTFRSYYGGCQTVRLSLVWKIGILYVLGSGIGRWGVEVLLTSIGLVIINIVAGSGNVSSRSRVLLKG